jgi:regulatory protein RepA
MTATAHNPLRARRSPRGEPSDAETPISNAVQAIMRDRSGLIDRFLEAGPPDREWVVENLIPLGVEGGIAAAGGVGKGWVEVDAACHVAIGRTWGPFRVPQPRGVMILAYEDDPTELHRRVVAILRNMQLDARELALLRENLEVKPLRGVAGAGLTDAFVDEIEAAASAMPNGVGLIFLDPLTRAVDLPDGLTLNNPEGAGHVLRVIGQICERTGATFVFVHHINKAAELEGREDSATAPTGSKQLVDLSRFVLSLRRLPAGEIAALGLPGGDEPGARKLLRLSVSKANAPTDEAAMRQWVLEILPEGGLRWHRSVGRLGSAIVREAMTELEDLVEGLGRPATRDEWRARMPSRDEADRARKQLVEGGVVNRYKRAVEVERGGKASKVDGFEPTADAVERLAELVARLEDEERERGGEAAESAPL